MLGFPLTKNALLNAISTSNVNTLQQMELLNMHEFGIFLELEPEEEAKATLEQNIQVALQTGSIDLDDVIDIRQVSNLKLANQLLKQKRKKKAKEAQEAQQANIQAQAQANAQAAEQAAMSEMQKQQALAQTELQIEQGKSQFKIQYLQQEAEIKKQLMAEEFNYNMQLAQIRANADQGKEKEIEDRKDERTRIQASQQSELIDQRKNDSLPKSFESSGMDTLGGFGLDEYNPS
tara:strand:- start:625 stop:1326 length:702 start_codon:yes stop_codon:yes gene_type:complete